MDKIRLRAYGKINLGLDVVRKREDGYHEVRMIMQTVGLHDRLEIVKTETPGIVISTNLSYLPVNENNLVYKAVKLLFDEFDIQKGVRISLHKYIPVAAGMAGGSSDCAAALFGINRLFGLGLDLEELMKRGVKLGADVPYCLMRGTALSEGIGEILTRVPAPPKTHVLIAKPAVSVSTKFVYENLRVNELESHPDIDGMVKALGDKNYEGIVDRLGNVLETVTIPAYPVIQELKDKMAALGADGVLMSGSGPTVFGLFRDEAKAKKAYAAMKKCRLAKQLYLTDFYNVSEAGGK